MNSRQACDVRGVVPDAGQLARRAVEGDRAADEQEPLDVALDGAELVRDVEDRRAELLVETREQRRKRLLRLNVDAGGRLVEDEQRRLGGQRLGDERALLLAAGERLQRGVGALGEPDARDRLVDDRAVAPAQGPEQPTRGEPSGRHHLAHGRGRLGSELAPLRQVAERAPPREGMGGLAEEERVPGERALEPEREPDQRRLAAAVRARDGDELALLDPQVDVVQDGRAVPVGERRLPAARRRPLRACECPAERGEVLAHDRKVVLAAVELLLRQSLERVEHGRARACLARDRLGELRRDERLEEDRRRAASPRPRRPGPRSPWRSAPPRARSR